MIIVTCHYLLYFQNFDIKVALPTPQELTIMGMEICTM